MPIEHHTLIEYAPLAIAIAIALALWALSRVPGPRRERIRRN